MSDLDSYKDSMRRFRLAKYMLEIESGKDGLNLPTYKGSTFRGGFGHAFRSMVCTMKKTDCTNCLLKEQCPYSYIFETSPGHRSEVLNNFEEVPRPYVIEPPPEKKTFYKPGEKIRFELILIGKAIEYLPYFLVTFVELGNMGIGRGRKPYVLRRVLGQNPFKKVEHLIYSDEDKKVRNCDITITGEDILNRADNGVHSPDQITLSFQTPTRIKYDNHFATKLEFHILIGNLLRRFSNLSYFHNNTKISIDYKTFVETATQVIIKNDFTVWEDWERYSSRQQDRMKMGGLVGNISYEGNLAPYLPLIILGEYIHAGKNITFGLGKYVVKKF